MSGCKKECKGASSSSSRLPPSEPQVKKSEPLQQKKARFTKKDREEQDKVPYPVRWEMTRKEHEEYYAARLAKTQEHITFFSDDKRNSFVLDRPRDEMLEKLKEYAVHLTVYITFVRGLTFEKDSDTYSAARKYYTSFRRQHPSRNFELTGVWESPQARSISRFRPTLYAAYRDAFNSTARFIERTPDFWKKDACDTDVSFLKTFLCSLVRTFVHEAQNIAGGREAQYACIPADFDHLLKEMETLDHLKDVVKECRHFVCHGRVDPQ